MRIVIPGGSGSVGAVLRRHFAARGDDVVVLSRHPKSAEEVAWDAETLGPWTAEIQRADVVINLVGRSVNCRYNERNRKEIIDSRVNSTRVIGQAIAQAKSPPKVWLQASTATIYAHRYDAPNDEATGIIGGDEPGVPETWRFSIGVARAWEQELDAADTPKTRKVAMRSAMIMSPDKGSVFDTLATLARRGLGGKAGDGRQYISWIHEMDFANAVQFLIEHDELSGAVNISSPNPIPNREFNQIMRRAVRAPFGLPTPAWLLEIGAVFIKTETELILKSRRVVPGRLPEAGFEFQYPEWQAAADELARRWRA